MNRKEEVRDDVDRGSSCADPGIFSWPGNRNHCDGAGCKKRAELAQAALKVARIYGAITLHQ